MNQALYQSILIASTNKGKIQEFKSFLSDLPIKVITQSEKTEIIENGNTFAENARIKAISLSDQNNLWTLADDSGLSVDVLNGAPGIYSSRFARTDDERVSKLLNILDGHENRNAQFHCALCIAYKGKVLLEVEGYCPGLITFQPRGSKGFGYDPIFEVLGTSLTFAEMEVHQKRQLGHRGKAFDLLKPELIKLLKIDCFS